SPGRTTSARRIERGGAMGAPCASRPHGRPRRHGTVTVRERSVGSVVGDRGDGRPDDYGEIMRLRRILLTTTATVTIGMMGAGPALAHYCYRSGWNEAATSNGRSQAWIPIEDFAAMIEAVEPEFETMCDEGIAIWDETIATLAA